LCATVEQPCPDGRLGELYGIATTVSHKGASKRSVESFSAPLEFSARILPKGMMALIASSGSLLMRSVPSAVSYLGGAGLICVVGAELFSGYP
jgi:hypothetical protein